MRSMIELGPAVEATTRVILGAMTVGSDGFSSMIIGPFKEWVFLGHDSLEIYFVGLNLTAAVFSISSTGGSITNCVQPPLSTGSYMVTSDGVLATNSIDAVSTDLMSLNGAEVLQWQQ